MDQIALWGFLIVILIVLIWIITLMYLNRQIRKLPIRRKWPAWSFWELLIGNKPTIKANTFQSIRIYPEEEEIVIISHGIPPMFILEAEGEYWSVYGLKEQIGIYNLLSCKYLGKVRKKCITVNI